MFEPAQFRFSIRRVICAGACFCVAALSFHADLLNVQNGSGLCPLLSQLLFLSAIGTGIGVIAGSALEGTMIGLFCFLFSLSGWFAVR
jgi:hypothetical protein